MSRALALAEARVKELEAQRPVDMDKGAMDLAQGEEHTERVKELQGQHATAVKALQEERKHVQDLQEQHAKALQEVKRQHEEDMRALRTKAAAATQVIYP